ncbi:GNAT family N-acetyltransferase [Patescibacteria group bacterium]|nr:GNAT family N-acetyltransferase [Patescibacteria group bacterium]
MQEGKIVFKGKTKKDKNIIIRYIKKEDLKKMWEYINTLSKERTFILFQGEEISLEDEEKYLNDQLGKAKQGTLVPLLAFCGKELVGISQLGMNIKTGKHIGIFGLSVLKKYRGEGIGKTLMEIVLKEAKEKLKGLRIVILSVFQKNCIAINLYKKMGFIEYGKLPEGVYKDGKYEDEILMYKKIQ